MTPWMWFVLAVLGLVLASELSVRWGGLAWVARKGLHAGVGVAVLLYRLWTPQGREALVGLSLVFALLHAVDLMGPRWMRAHRVEPRTAGTVWFPLSVAGVALWTWQPVERFTALLAPMFFADPAGALVGRTWPLRRWNGKSLGGTLAVGLVTALLLWRLGWSALAVAVGAVGMMLVEGVLDRGWDNLGMPLAMGVLVVLLKETSTARMVGALILVAGLVPLAVRFRWLIPRGAATAAVLGLVLVLAGGWTLILPMLAFFVTGSLLSHRLRRPHAPGETRTAAQVLANGGPATLFGVLYGVLGDPLWYVGYLAVLAEAAADTWATEVGAHSPVPPRRLGFGPVVHPGESGGITPLGTLGAWMGALLIASFALMVRRPGWILPLSLLGLAGSFVDSLLGATVEARRRCGVCGGLYDTPFHCGQPTVPAGGWSWLDNNAVNLTAGVLTGLVALGWMMNM